MTAPRGSTPHAILDDAIRQFECVAGNIRAITSPAEAVDLLLAAAGSLRRARDDADAAGEMGGATLELTADEAQAVSTALRWAIDQHEGGTDDLEAARRKLHRAVAARATQRSARAVRFLGGIGAGRVVPAEAVADSDDWDGVGDEPKPHGRDAL